MDKKKKDFILQSIVYAWCFTLVGAICMVIIKEYNVLLITKQQSIGTLNEIGSSAIAGFWQFWIPFGIWTLICCLFFVIVSMVDEDGNNN